MKFYIPFFILKPLKAGMSFTVMTSLHVDYPYFSDVLATDGLAASILDSVGFHGRVFYFIFSHCSHL